MPQADILEKLGLENTGPVHWNLSTAALYEEAVRHREAKISHLGPLVVRTGPYTGRSPNDKFIVYESETEDLVWWGASNHSFATAHYEHLRDRVLAYLQGRDLYVQDVYAGADPKHQIAIQVISESAWHALFARTMFIRELDEEKLKIFDAEYTLIHVPHFHAIPKMDATNSEVFVVLNFQRKEIIIGGSAYAGEMKKAVFTLMNYLLPVNNVLSMHCSANYGKDTDDVALFFGLSGTGKTTLSIDTTRKLVGDDEHGWNENGIFNLEGGCYAKVIRLSKENEPEIYATTRRFGTILENVTIVDQRSRRLDFDDDSLTENTRAAFPITHLSNASPEQMVGHPKQIFFLTADAFGVLPPLAHLTPDQAVYYFLQGYTAKVAGTERGVTEPQATFSPCFGAPFMVLSPTVYAKMLGEDIQKYDVNVWLVNTGWTGGPYGEGQRMDLPYTRAMVRAVMEEKLDEAIYQTDPMFGLQIPTSVPGVPEKVLIPRNTWADQVAYDAQAEKLAKLFIKNFEKFSEEVPEAVKESGPKLVHLGG